MTFSENVFPILEESTNAHILLMLVHLLIIIFKGPNPVLYLLKEDVNQMKELLNHFYFPALDKPSCEIEELARGIVESGYRCCGSIKKMIVSRVGSGAQIVSCVKDDAY